MRVSNLRRTAVATGSAVALAVGLGCSESPSLTGGDTGSDDGATSPDVPDAIDVPDLAVEVDSFGDADGRDPGGERDAFPDPGPPDPWVPDSWDVPFEYMDIPPDYVPDAAACGNGVVDPGEECDDGNTNDNDECTNRCLFPRCGDGVVWHVLEDCDPPGSIRPCRSSCDTTGGEWCDSYCQWTGTCIPPREICGNGIDDDCDGVVDLIVRETPNVVISDRPVSSTPGAAVAWTGSEFAVVWRTFAGGAVLTRLDEWGRRVDWDTDLIDEASELTELRDLYWTGSLLGLFWVTGYWDGGSWQAAFHFRVYDGAGTPRSDPISFAGDPWCCDEERTAWSGTGFGLMNPGDQLTGSRRPHYRYRSIAPDGSSVSDFVEVGDYLYVDLGCLVWTGSQYAVLVRNDEMRDPGLHEKRLDLVSVDGTLTRSSVAAIEPYDARAYDCEWVGPNFAVVTRLSPSPYLRLVVLGPDGAAVHGEDVVLLADETGLHADLVPAAGETGLFWNDARTGNQEIYFGRFDENGARIDDDARLTRTPYESSAPAAVWTGDSYGVVWNDSDGTDEDIYFTRFSLCP